jgi:hypothetical protein
VQGIGQGLTQQTLQAGGAGIVLPGYQAFELARRGSGDRQSQVGVVCFYVMLDRRHFYGLG